MEQLSARLIRGALWGTLSIPLVLTSASIYPQMLPRTTLFQFLIEGALLALLLIFLANALRGRTITTWLPEKWWKAPPLLAGISFFGISAFVSALSALDTQRAWFGVASWGNEGMLMYLHYLAFLFLSLAYFSRKDVLRYLFAGIGVGTILAVFAVLQFVGIDPFELTPDAGGRVGSFLENPTYLAAYLTVLLAIAGILLRHGGSYEFLPAKIRIYATRFLVGFVALALLVIGLTQTRGALVGVVAGTFVFLGILVLRAPSSYRVAGLSLKMVGASAAAILVVFGGVFWTTRQSDFWSAIPVLSRAANISVTDPTVATRLISLQISRDAFMERPLLGWGPDNSYIAHTKYYQPELFWYEETWFERMHNKIADVAVNQGIFGLATFAALWTVLGLAVWRDIRSGVGITQLAGGALVAGGLVAYMGQNMFAFDLPVSYIAFFSVLLFYTKEAIGDGDRIVPSIRFRFMKIAGVVIVLPILLYLFFGFTYIPFRQSTLLISSIEGGPQKLEENADEIYAPETHIQRDIHRVAMIELQNAGAWDYPVFRSALERLIEESARRTEIKEYDPRSAIFLGVFALSGGYTDQAEYFARIGLERAPLRPDAYHGLGRALMHGQKFDEAQDIFRKGIELNERVASSHFYYATSLALEDATNDSVNHKDEALAEFEKAQALGVVMSMSRYDTLGSALFEYRQWDQLGTVMAEATRENPDSSRFHQMALSASLVDQDKEVALASVTTMIQLNTQSPQVVTRLERVRSFVENERWADARREMGIE